MNEDEYYAAVEPIAEEYREEIHRLERELQKYKDLESAFSLDLKIVVNALMNGIYRMHNGKIEYLMKSEFWLDSHGDCFLYGWPMDPNRIRFSDYGKKCEDGWALTKEELE